MSTDFIPGAKPAFATWVTQFLKGIKQNTAALGLSQAEVDAVDAAVKQWDADGKVHDDAVAAVHAASKQDQKSHDALDKIVRTTVHVINGNPAIDNALRGKANLPPHDNVITPIGAPTTKPLLRAEVKGHFTLMLHAADETTPLRTAKPHGVHGYRIFRHLGDPAPTDPAAFTYVNTSSRTPYADIHSPADAGKTVSYIGCWESPKHEQGPWSDVLTTKVPG